MSEAATRINAFLQLCIWDADIRFAVFSEQILDSLKRVPGIVEAGATTMPLLSFGPGADLMIHGEAASEKKPGHAVEMQVVTPGYFSALGTTLLRGRFLFTC